MLNAPVPKMVSHPGVAIDTMIKIIFTTPTAAIAYATVGFMFLRLSSSLFKLQHTAETPYYCIIIKTKIKALKKESRLENFSGGSANHAFEEWGVATKNQTYS